jgi:DNA polymerase-3 subunit delta
LFYILSGEDDFSLAHELEAIRKSLGDQEMLSTNTNVLDGKTVSYAEFQSVCESAPFLSEKRLVIVRDLLDRFGEKAPSAKAKTPKKAETKTPAFEAFGNCIFKLSPSTVLVLIEDEIKDSNPLLKMISVKAKIRNFSMLKTPELRQWVTNHIIEQNCKISVTALNLLVKLIGSNLWVMTSELDKLASYAYGRQIEEKDVKALVSYTQQTRVFDLVDAIMEFKSAESQTLLQQMMDQGATATYLLSMVYRQMRLIVRARDLKRQGVKEQDMRQKLGVASEFVVKKTLEQAARYSMPRIKQVYQQLLDTDIAIKTGKYTEELALNILIAELCMRTPVAA